jgi:predicted nucleic acid-binding protein
MVILLDTNIIIDVLKDHSGTREMIRGLIHKGHEFASCAVTVAEVHAGMRRHEVSMTNEFLDGLNYYEISEATAKLAGALKSTWASKGRTLGLPDILIAAVALEHGLYLATNNRKDFPMPELKFLTLPPVH